jgi:hypothetical protein
VYYYFLFDFTLRSLIFSPSPTSPISSLLSGLWPFVSFFRAADWAVFAQAVYAACGAGVICAYVYALKLPTALALVFVV